MLAHLPGAWAVEADLSISSSSSSFAAGSDDRVAVDVDGSEGWVRVDSDKCMLYLWSWPWSCWWAAKADWPSPCASSSIAFASPSVTAMLLLVDSSPTGTSETSWTCPRIVSELVITFALLPPPATLCYFNSCYSSSITLSFASSYPYIWLMKSLSPETYSFSPWFSAETSMMLSRK